MPILPSQVTEAAPPVLTGRYLPTAQDILTIRSYFLLLRKPLCYELVDIILDEAGLIARSKWNTPFARTSGTERITCTCAHSPLLYPVLKVILSFPLKMSRKSVSVVMTSPHMRDYIHAAGSCLSYGAMTRAGQPLIPAITERTRDRTPGGMLLSRPHSWKSLVI